MVCACTKELFLQSYTQLRMPLANATVGLYMLVCRYPHAFAANLEEQAGQTKARRVEHREASDFAMCFFWKNNSPSKSPLVQ